MHSNRYKYSLNDYQQVLEKRDKNFSLLLEDKETKKQFIYFPKTRSMWHQKFIKDYVAFRSFRMFNRLKIGKSRMLTLTYDVKLYTPEQVAKRHKKDLKKFIREIRKEYKDFKYSYFIELTKNLYIHFHMYFDIYITQKKIKTIWHKITGSKIVHISLIKTERQKLYTATYNAILGKFNKEQLKFAWKHISRFFGTARGYFQNEKQKENKYNRLLIVKLNGYILQQLKKLNQEAGQFFLIYEDFENYISRLNTNIIFTKDLKVMILNAEKNP